jgi:hypothetical protein
MIPVTPIRTDCSAGMLQSFSNLRIWIPRIRSSGSLAGIPIISVNLSTTLMYYSSHCLLSSPSAVVFLRAIAISCCISLICVEALASVSTMASRAQLCYYVLRLVMLLQPCHPYPQKNCSLGSLLGRLQTYHQHQDSSRKAHGSSK